MMDLRVSVVLLFVFLTGGYSLKCYTCTSLMSSCKEKEQTCPDGFYKCASSIVEQSADSKNVYFTTKGCVSQCERGTLKINGVTASLRCCGTDLCNAADGVYKGSFLLLFSPLLFYFLFQ